MGCQLQCEGFRLNDEVRDELMFRVREFAGRVGKSYPVQVAVKQVDGLVQSRVELALSQRKVSAVVLRKDPLLATQIAIDALAEIVGGE